MSFLVTRSHVCSLRWLTSMTMHPLRRLLLVNMGSSTRSASTWSAALKPSSPLHVEAAARIARHACDSNVRRLLHISGIGADSTAHSPYICSRGRGEAVVKAAFPDAIIVRSAAMFGPDDAFLAPILSHLRRLPVYPMFGRGSTRLQPVYVEDVAEAIARCVGQIQAPGTIFECGGPCIYSYSQLLKALAVRLVYGRFFSSCPLRCGIALAFFAEFLSNPPFTRNQVELMQIVNVASPQPLNTGSHR